MHEDPENGEPLEWNQPVRIRHVLYRRYIKVMFTESYLTKNNLYYKPDGTLKYKKNTSMDSSRKVGFASALKDKAINEADNYYISLVDDYQDPHTLFELKPVVAATDEDYIPSNSILRIMHRTTQSYIKVQDDITKFGDTVRRDQSISFDYWFSDLKNEGEKQDSQVELEDDENSSAGNSESDGRSHGSRTSAGTNYSQTGRYAAGWRTIRKILMTKEGVDQHVFMVTGVKNITYDYIQYS